jgi:hypothetical protein
MVPTKITEISSSAQSTKSQNLFQKNSSPHYLYTMALVSRLALLSYWLVAYMSQLLFKPAAAGRRNFFFILKLCMYAKTATII